MLLKKIQTIKELNTEIMKIDFPKFFKKKRMKMKFKVKLDFTWSKVKEMKG